MLTTQQLDRALMGLRELLEARIDAIDKAVQIIQGLVDKVPGQIDENVAAVKELHEERFRATVEVRHQLDIRTQQQFADRDLRSTEHEARNTATWAQIERAFQQQFSAIQQQFLERDERSNQSEQNARTAVDAALQAAKEAVQAQNNSSALAIAKSESATDKRIENMATVMTGANGALVIQINDLKDRVTRIEGKEIGQVEAKVNTNQNVGLILGVIGAIVGVGGVLIGAIAWIVRAGGAGVAP